MSLQPTPRLAVSMFFIVTGFMSASWIARIPAAADHLDLGKAELGTLLLFIGIGSVAAFQVVGRIIERLGSARTANTFAYGMCVMLILLALAPNPLLLGTCLFIYGFCFGGVDVAMNAQGVAVERMLKKPIMGSLHGFFSLGALAGAAGSGFFAAAGLGLIPNFVTFSLLSLLAVLWVQGAQISDPDPEPATEAESKPRFALPPRILWPLGAIAFCAALGEGGMADWSALYIHDELNGSEELAAFGFTAFSLTMLIGRFAGDRIVARFGAARVVRVGSIVSSLALLAGLIPGTTAAAVAGFAGMGIGLSVIIPVVYSAAGATPGISSGRGVAAVATIGYTGFLLGPPVLGWFAELTSLQIALGVIVVGLGVITFFTPSLQRTPAPDPT